MKKNILLPYNIDMEYEVRTYNNVGRDHKIANRQQKILRYIYKIRYGKQKSYAICNTYSDWERHIKGIIPIKILNYNDFLHWLYRQRQNGKMALESIKIIAVPIYIAFIHFLNLSNHSIAEIFIIFVFIIFASMFLLVKYFNELNFLNDFIKIAESMKEDSTIN